MKVQIFTAALCMLLASCALEGLDEPDHGTLEVLVMGAPPNPESEALELTDINTGRQQSFFAPDKRSGDGEITLILDGLLTGRMYRVTVLLQYSDRGDRRITCNLRAEASQLADVSHSQAQFLIVEMTETCPE